MNQPVDQQVDGLIRYGGKALPEGDANGLVRFRVDLGYDGTNFSGWAKQPGLRTVQSVLVKALTLVFGDSGDDFALRVAGRTDAGVHAEMQVAHFDLHPSLLKRMGRSRDLRRKINSLLPSDVRVHSIEVAPPGFDARFSASFRRYRYRIADLASIKNPIQERYTLWMNYELDLIAMQAVALEFYGLHDFASFCKAKPNATTIRELREINISRNPLDFNVVEVEILADAFCHNMVRSLMGALIAVGQGKATHQEVIDTMARKTRVGSFKVMLPQGLTLIEIGYPPVELLAEQAEKSRSMRDIDEA